MARSSVPSSYHDGMDRHPSGPEGVAAPAPLHGRWVAAITPGRLGVDVGGKRFWERLDPGTGPLLAPVQRSLAKDLADPHWR